MTADVHQANPSYTGSRPELLALVSRPWADALDVGCAQGALGHALKAARGGGRVTGIELDPELAQAAAARLDRVIAADATSALETLVAERARFDLIFCGDILEHLTDPWTALKMLRQLCPDGDVIVSLPNVGHWTTLVSVGVLGTWPYRDRGIHDRTHLRFFARRNLAPLFSSAGFRLHALERSHRFLETPGRWSRFFGRCIGWIPMVGRFTTYQFLCVIR